MFQVFSNQELPSFGDSPTYVTEHPVTRRASGGGTCALCVRGASGGAVSGSDEGVALWQIMLGGAALLFMLAFI